MLQRHIPPVLLILSTVLASCGESTVGSTSEIVFPDSNVSFRGQVLPLLNLGCNFGGCHDAPRADNQYIALTSWSEVRNIRVVNQPGDTNSGLVRVVYGREIHNAALPRLNENQKRGIKQWVLEGARDN